MSDFNFNPTPARYQEEVLKVGNDGKTQRSWITKEEASVEPLGIPIKVTRPRRDGTFETVQTDTLSNAKYMADYQAWYAENGEKVWKASK